MPSRSNTPPRPLDEVDQGIIDTLIESGFSKEDAEAELKALIEWAGEVV